jgi:hypothetical protein
MKNLISDKQMMSWQDLNLTKMDIANANIMVRACPPF